MGQVAGHRVALRRTEQLRQLAMGRPKEFDRDEAINTVLNQVWEHGYEACSVKALSESLGITRSSFYNAFGSREELFLEVVEAFNGPTPNRDWFPIDDDCSVLKSISDGIRSVCKARIDDKAARGCLLINSITELVGRHQKLGPAIGNVFAANIQYLEGLLNVAVERGELDDCDVHTKALALQSVLVGLHVMSKAIRDEDELWAATKHSLESLGLYRD